jgi:transposase
LALKVSFILACLFVPRFLKRNNPTDRSKQGSKLHLLVDKQGAPLAVYMTGANRHAKWLADDLIISMVVSRPDPAEVEQPICMDRGYDYEDVPQFVEQVRYFAHIKHRRCQGEPPAEDCLAPGKTQFPPRRWVVERTLGCLLNAAACVSVGEKKSRELVGNLLALTF